MAFEGLSGKLNQVFKKLKSHGKLTESDVKAAMREVRMALLEADVSYKVVKDFVQKVSERAVGEEVLNSSSRSSTKSCAASWAMRTHASTSRPSRRASS